MAIGDTSLAPTATIASSSRATPCADLTEVDQAPPLADSSKPDQLGVSEALADPDGLHEPGVGCRHITREHGRARDGASWAVDPKTEAWLTWAAEHADSIDPLLGPLFVPEAPEPSRSALEPFLDGWSPYTPDRRGGGFRGL